ncbi:MAG: hypothetical protein KAJ19_12365 [Gammaproteobacteria bacterium]|nr:hypothetical protein [Gammaproteobacteria bacterium]
MTQKLIKTIGKPSSKPYKCRTCGMEYEVVTNHWGAIYSTCPAQWKHPTETDMSDCQESPPAGYWVPSEWKKSKLSNLVDLFKS